MPTRGVDCHQSFLSGIPSYLFLDTPLPGTGIGPGICANHRHARTHSLACLASPRLACTIRRAHSHQGFQQQQLLHPQSTWPSPPTISRHVVSQIRWSPSLTKSLLRSMYSAQPNSVDSATINPAALASPGKFLAATPENVIHEPSRPFRCAGSASGPGRAALLAALPYSAPAPAPPPPSSSPPLHHHYLHHHLHDAPSNLRRIASTLRTAPRHFGVTSRLHNALASLLPSPRREDHGQRSWSFH